MSGINTVYVIYALAAVTGILIAEAVYLLFSGRQDKRHAINRRLRLQDKKISQKEVLVQLRKERGSIGDSHASPFTLEGLRVLRMQSGLTMSVPNFLGICSGVAAAIAGGAWFSGVELLFALPLFPVLSVVLPFMFLRRMRTRRHKAFGLQLPEALELITRSLKAGHPVPVAIGLVAREMPDPIGTEFGIVADEITYGSDLVSALAALYERVGHDDLPLFVTAVSIQNSTGGNLREILDGLSATIRERGKLKRKVRAISTEGRMSAYVLTAVPTLLFAGIQLMNPSYYQNVMDEDLTWYLLGFAVFWAALGNMVMSKMSNFKF